MPPTIFHPALVTPLDKDPSDSYIYDIAPLTSSASETQPQTLVSITSTNSLYCLDAETLRAVSKMQLDMEGDGGFTALRGVNENMVVTSGRNGVVCVWDVREEGRMVGEFKRGGNKRSPSLPFLSLAVSDSMNAIAAGEEYTGYVARVVVWDIRTMGAPPLRQYSESHNDDITELKFVQSGAALGTTSSSQFLLSGSTDGLVNIYDLDINPPSATSNQNDTPTADDDEALHQVINHGSSIHRAGFLPSNSLSRSSIYALSHDEIFSVYKLNDKNDLDKEHAEKILPDVPPPIDLSLEKEDENKQVFGDLRKTIPECDYIVDFIVPNVTSRSMRSTFLVAGANKDGRQWVELLPASCTSSDKSKIAQWDFIPESRVRLEGGHGEEVVRCVYVWEKARTIYTGGEDGLVKVWRGPEDSSSGFGTGIQEEGGEKMEIEDDEDDEDDKAKQKRDKKEKKERKKKEKRFKPY